MKPKIENLGKVSITVEKDPYDAAKAYPKLTIVYIEGDYRTYISRKPVLPNTSILDKEFWIPFSSLSEQLLINYNGFKALVLEDLASQNNKIDTTNRVLNQFINSDITALIESALQNLAVVIDSNYVHTDNNYTTTEKNKLGALPTNADLQTALTNIINTFGNYYTKLQTYSKSEIDTKVQTVTNALNTLIGTNNVTTAIDTFNEIVTFLADYENNGDLKDIIDALESAVKTWANNKFVESVNLYNNIYNKTEINNKFADYLLTTEIVSTYLSKTDAASLYQQKGSYLVAADITGKAEKSELTITPGTEENSDKTTIQLKNGVSTTVLTQHQDISGKANSNDVYTKSQVYTKSEIDQIILEVEVGQGSDLQNYYTKTQIDSQQTAQNNEIALKANKAEMSVVNGTDDDSDKTTITLKQGLSATVLTDHQPIKTLNNQSIIGEGDIEIEGGPANMVCQEPYSGEAIIPESDLGNIVLFSPDSGEGIVPSDGIRAESVNAGAAMTINPDVVTVINGAVGTAAITLQVPQDNLAHVWDILLTTDSSVAITFAMSNSATILYPDGFSIGASKAVEVSVIGVGTKYYLRYGEFA